MTYTTAVPAAAVLMGLLALHAPARATSSIYYSAPENTYGWCTGDSVLQTSVCAIAQCAKAGGTDCKLAVQCGGSWSAIAFARDPARGIGTSCGIAGRDGARMIALAACMSAAKTLCRTNATFDGNGRKASERSDRVFDLVWLSQGLLGIRRYYDGEADGELGPGTRAAIRSFQTRLGRPATGALDHELFDRLIDAVGGVQRFVAIVERDILEPRRDALGARIFAQASSPAVQRSFSLELALRPRDSRLTGLATYLASDGHPCSLPALDATAVRDASSGVWVVDCVEGGYTVDLTPGSAKVTPRVTEPVTEPVSKEHLEMLREIEEEEEEMMYEEMQRLLDEQNRSRQ